MQELITVELAKSADQVAFFTVKEAARHLHLCEKQVRRLIARGDLQAYRFGAALRIKRKDVEGYIAVSIVRRN